MEYAENLINIKQRGRGPIILWKHIKKYGRIGASYTDDLGRRLEALHCTTKIKLDRVYLRPVHNVQN